MNKLKSVGVAAFIGVLIGVALWWAASETKDRKDPLNKSDAYVYSDTGILYWFELSTSRSGKLEGKLHKKSVIEAIGKEPIMKQKEYHLTGKRTDKGYEFKGNINGKMTTFVAWFSEGDFFVQQQGTMDRNLFKPVDKEELNKYEKGIQQELESAIYHSEEKEKNRLRDFFSQLNSIYGFLYSKENSQLQLFIKIDEALLQGELRGSLLVITETGDKDHPYEETKYVLNGITDGQMVQFYTTVDGKKTKLKGHFYNDVSGFSLTFWNSDQKLPFHAVTEDEFKQAIAKTALKKNH